MSWTTLLLMFSPALALWAGLEFARYLPRWRARGVRLGRASHRAPRFFARMTEETARLLLGSGSIKWK